MKKMEKSTAKAANPERKGMWGNNTGVSQGMIPGRKFWGPLFLITVPPVFVMLVWYTNFHLKGSFLALFNSFLTVGVF